MKKGKKQKTKLRYKVRREGKRIAAQLRQTLGRLASVPATPLQTADDQGSR
jgi:hypothetical protein